MSGKAKRSCFVLSVFACLVHGSTLLAPVDAGKPIPPPPADPPIHYQIKWLDIMENDRSAWDVNSRGDVCITGTKRAYLYTDDEGLWAFDDMVTGEAADVDMWRNATITYVEHMNDPNDTGFGRICGRAVLTAKVRGKISTTVKAFLLIPMLP